MKIKPLISTALISLLFVVGTVQADVAVIKLNTNSENSVTVSIVAAIPGMCSLLGGTYNINQNYEPQFPSSTKCPFTVYFGPLNNATQVCDPNNMPATPSFAVTVTSTNGNLSCTLK